MNAYELADELELSAKRAEDHGTIAKRSKMTANILRQQAGELEYYKVRDSSHIKIIKEQADRIVELEKYEKQIKQMEKAYDAHFKKGMGLNE